MKIDIVYLWVDDTDKKWRTEKDKWFQEITGHAPVVRAANGTERWRDNGEFKHSLRSVEMFAPWVNHIYIVTGFGQKPKWLNTKNPKISIVSHETIMPKNTIPTFNATSIEMCIPNIPGLSEHFLLMNDDMFFNRALTPDYFFDSRGRAIVRHSNVHGYHGNVGRYMETVDSYSQTLILCSKIIHDVFGKKTYKYRPSHGIDPYIKSSWITARNHPLINRTVDYTTEQKFRTNNQIQRWLFNLYDLIHGRAVFVHAHARKCTRHKILDKIYNTIHWRTTRNSAVVFSDCRTARDALLHAPIFCINDAPDSDEETLRANAEFMAWRFPNKSQFEK